MFDVLVRDPLARILDGDNDVAAFELCRDGNHPSFFDGLCGVNKQIHEYLVQPIRKALYRWDIRSVVLDDVDLPLDLVVDEIEGTVDTFLDTDGLELCLVQPHS